MGSNVHYEYPYGKNLIVYLHPPLSNHRIWVCLNSNALLAFLKNGVVRVLWGWPLHIPSYKIKKTFTQLSLSGTHQ